MQRSLAGNLSNVVVKNHAKVDVTVASKNYSVQNYTVVKGSAKFITKQTYLQLTKTCSKLAT